MQEDNVRERLDSLIRASGEGYAELSRLIGRNPAYLQQFIKRGVPRRLAETDRRILATHFNVSERILGSPDSPKYERLPGTGINTGTNTGTGSSCAVQENPYMLVPFLDGICGQHEPGPPRDALALDPSFAGLLSQGRPASLAAHRIQGDSMQPTLADGDNVLIDMKDHAGPRDGVYAIRTEAGVLIKRIGVHPATKRLSVISDNAAYPAFFDCDPSAIDILGRVIWAGRRIS